MAKVILKVDKAVLNATLTINSQLTVGKKLQWESRKGKSVIIAGGVRAGETTESGETVVKLVIKNYTYETKVTIPADAKKVIVTAKLTGLQKLMGHLGFIGKGFVAASIIAGKGIKFTAKAK